MLTKKLDFELELGMETLKEAQRIFTEASTLDRVDQMGPRVDPSIITTFLETCMKLLHDSKVIQGLQELIMRCAGLGETHVV